MDEKTLRKLKKQELLEILAYMRKEIDYLNEENDKLKEQLDRSRSSQLLTEIKKGVEENSSQIEKLYQRLLSDFCNKLMSNTDLNKDGV
jgi:tRNA U34 5-carboxymethylaminomethyl modifying GTPase MnmE/TrmE